MNKKKLILIVLIILIILTGIIFFILNYGYSTGVRSGRLVKLSKKGLIIKTYEGTLDLGSGDKLTWDFSTHDNDLGDNLIKHTGKTVRLDYKEHLFKLYYNTKYNITSWQLLEDDVAQKNLLCRFVNLVRTRPEIVETLRPIIQKNDPDLLVEIRKCQAL